MTTDATELTKDEILDAVVPWWTSRLEIEEKRGSFATAFRARLAAALYRRENQRGLESASRARGWWADNVVTDYDPMGPLLDALHDVGIECRGCMFSARGIFPQKHRTFIRGTYVEAVEGYGGNRTIIAGKAPEDR